MRAVFEAFPDLFFRIKNNGQVLSSQSGHPSSLYVPVTTLIGKNIHDIPIPSIRDKFVQSLSQLLDKEKPVNLVCCEFSLEQTHARDSYEARFLPLVNNQTFVIVRNITARKKAEQAVAAEKELLSVTLRSIADGVITTDTHGKITLINKVAEQLLGRSQKQALGCPIESVMPVLDEKSHKPAEHVAKQVLRCKGSQAANQVGWLQIADKKRLISNSATPLRNRSSQLVGTVVAFRDITEQRNQQDDRLRASKLDSIGLLAGGIAHDFNNILSSILCNVSLANTSIEPQL